ncbi:glycerol-3-phosphate acyltransferase [Azospira sp. I13]|uniref:glycerol-3-phosphate 1-O-acyltransferase PlsY n=1 Tax=Azospira sp. I13 TaxID=1765050 RepID=UPI000D49C514|nr:glycerol-3-phosphate 1-O-acyltransferase PlsY [Azospira sp. I13]GBG01977.1 glycerol-3-phosphate acyltransferase [Azospira sp. I13]
MTSTQTLPLALIAAYLLGSVPFAVIVSRGFGLADPRSYGSGNPGATNVLRSGNKLAALLTLLGDAAKGALAVILARLFLDGQAVEPSAERLLLGGVALAVFFGHLFPVFLKFKGGKGVATAAGVLLALDPLLGLATLGLWLGTAALSRYSSLAALVAASGAPLVAGMLWGFNLLVAAVAIMAMALVAKHWANIQRLLAGQESKIGGKKKASTKAPKGH